MSGVWAVTLFGLSVALFGAMFLRIKTRSADATALTSIVVVVLGALPTTVGGALLALDWASKLR